MFKKLVNSIRCCFFFKYNKVKEKNMSIEKLIGNTPMIKIIVKYNKKIINVYAKLEYYNYTGSIKDRIANYIILKSYEEKMLKKICQS